MELVFVDLETGGLDPQRHAITQIAAIACDESLNELETFECKCRFKPESADPEALALNSYNADVWAREAIDPREACSRLSEFLKRHADVRMLSKAGREYWVAQLVGHNAATFDGPFLQAWYKRLDQWMPAGYRVLCTLQRAQWWFLERPEVTPPESFKLTDLAKYFGVELPEAHDALADCRATVGLYRALCKSFAKEKPAA